MSDQPVETQPSDSQQVTSTTPTTKPAKNPKRVAAGKAIAEKTRLAREAQKKVLDEANAIIANNKAKETPPPPHVPDTNNQNVPVEDRKQQNVLNTTQWLSVVSILVSLIGLYYKPEEIKRFFSPQTPPSQPLLEETEIQRPPTHNPKNRIRLMD